MRNGLIASSVVVLILGAAGSACTDREPGPVTGQTRVVECGGAPPPDGGSTCQPPRPASGEVTASRDGQVIARARSDEAGEFRMVLAAGTYEVTALLDDFGEVAWCDTVTVIVGRSTRPAPVVITCTVAYP
jgi:hypothetical protein